MSARKHAFITGIGSYLPEKVLTNQDLAAMVDTTDEWIVSRTGMKERRVAHASEFTSEMGSIAATRALESAGLQPTDIDLILVATMSPDYISPSTAVLVQARLQAINAAALDIQAACTGFIFGLSMAKAYIESGTYRNILLIASEKMSAFVDYKDRNTCVLFGDGASAAVIRNQGPGLTIQNVQLGSDGEAANLLVIPAGGTRNPATAETVSQGMHYIKMQGKELFKHAIRRMSSAAVSCLEQCQLTDAQLTWLVPHQANERIIDALANNLNIPLTKIYKTVHKYGNTSASGIAIALDELTQNYPPHHGDNLLLVAFGAGLTWGAVVLTKSDNKG